MVSLDEQIQKDKQQHKSHKGGRNQSIGNDKRNKKFNRGGPVDKHRGIRKGDREVKPRPFRKDREDRGPQKFNQVKRQNAGRPHPKPLREEKGGKKASRISRAPIKESNNEIQQNEAAQEKGRTLKVMGLHPDFTNQDLYKLFSTEGALEKCLIEQDNFGRSMTTAIVKYHNVSSAKSAITNLNSHKVMNSILTVEPYKNINRR